ncbi:MAG: iron-sulfur cluster carrier protein ApbC [Cellvibrionales bacterium]|nr:iron-sulfur cluster carrier protein ApbC [Cellvibrionales bacterium]
MSNAEVVDCLSQYQDAYYPNGIPGSVIALCELQGSTLDLKLSIGFPLGDKKMAFTDAIKQHVLNLPTISSVSLAIDETVQPHLTQNNLPSLHRVKNIIAVASGKGGVGKSTVSVNLAIALGQLGARVGILDADIYGPSQSKMLNIEEGTRPEFIDEKRFKPIEAYGIQSMSMGYMVTENTPMVWRGPMVSGALTQLLNQCTWNDLDYLIVDMPPGTGDIQLTLAQQVPVAASVIVTTPQEIALLDAKKGIEMFAKTGIPVLGLVENMALHTCSQCGHQEAIFGEGGGQVLSERYQVPLLASLPLNPKTREGMDAGKPPVAIEPEGELAQTFRDVARKVTALLAQRPINQRETAATTIATDA